METRKRPIRACTSKSSSTPAPAVDRSISKKKRVEDEPVILPAPAEEDRQALRCMWELASVMNFFNTFRAILNVKEFTFEELETGILTCNSLLADIHISLIKGIHPVARASINRENWVSFLYKKLKDRWTQVAEGPFPLAGAHGTEAVVYKGLDSPVRLIILKALCEIRLDQEDVRPLMEQSVKKGNISGFRKERICANLIGTLYWLENDSVSGYRLYKEVPPPKAKEFRGKAAPPPPASTWETLATNLEEFQAVSDLLVTSKFKQEIGLGRRLKKDVLPVLEAIQKKKERAHKRQQRQANLLEISLQENGVAGGRTRRDRKPVNYTFDDFDRSINEAIKHTRKRVQSPEEPGEALENGHATTTPPEVKKYRVKRRSISDHAGEREALDSPRREDDGEPGSSDEAPAISNGVEHSDQQAHSPRNRQRKRSQRYNEQDYVDAAYAEEDDLYSDDEIEGEAIYDEEFIRSRKLKQKRGNTSPEDDDYRSNDEQELGELGVSHSDEEGRIDKPEKLSSRSSRRSRRVKQVENLGLRRSKRVTRTRVDYRGYQESEEDQEDYGGGLSELANGKDEVGLEDEEFNLDGSSEEPEMEPEPEAELEPEPEPSNHNQFSDGVEREEEVEDEEDDGDDDDDEGGDEEGEKDWSCLNGDGGGGEGEMGRKQLRFLDLNQCAPAADSPREWLMNNISAPG